MRSLLSLGALALLAWTPLPQTVTPPVRLVSPAPIEAFGTQTRIASNGRGFFTASTGGWGMAFDDRGERLSEESSATSGINWGPPAVASNGTNYLQVWLVSSVPDRSPAYPALYARRVTAEGEAIDREPIVVQRFDTFFPSAQAPAFSVAWDGSRYIIAFERPNGTNVAKFVSEAGVLAADEIAVAGAEVAASRSGAVLFVTHQTEDILNERLLLVQALHAEPVTLGRGSQAVLAAGNGEFLAAWDDGGDVWAQRLAMSGQPAAPAMRLANRALEPAVTWVNDHWLVVFTKQRGTTESIEGVRIGTEVIDASPFAIAENASRPAVASNGSRVLVSWYGNGRYGAMLDGTTVSDVFPLTRVLGPTDVAVQMAAVGDTTLVAVRLSGETSVWAVRNGSARHLRTFPGIFATLAGGGGHALLATYARWFVLDADANVIAETPAKISGFWLDVTAVWTGSAYLVTWAEPPHQPLPGYDIMAVTFAPDGTITPARRITNSVQEPALAHAKDSTLVAWGLRCGDCIAGEIEGPDGRHRDFEYVTNDPELYGHYAQTYAATDGENFLVLKPYRRVYLHLVRPDGTIARSITLSGPRVVNIAWVGWTGEFYLILATKLDEHLRQQLYALRVDRAGTLIDPDFTRVAPLFTAPRIASALIRGNGEIEIITAGAEEPFGTPMLNWRKLTGPRRRAVR